MAGPSWNPERQMAGNAALDVFEGESGPAFRLPCTRLDGNACELYWHRPLNCAGYRCGLLDKSEGPLEKRGIGG
ncbi:MAG TPA: hypothetical protein VFO45_03735 [Sphingomicrobium sp.]|nr:hypothetical protein [Sphingomicrobium sp.]